MDRSWIAETARSYDRVAEPYLALVSEGIAHLPLESSLVSHFAAQVQATGGGRVIDLGCGPGLLTRHLAALGLTTVGVDVSPEMLRIAASLNPGLEFIEASVTELPVEAGSAGGVFCWYVAHHIPDDALGQVFTQIARALRPGGRLMLGGHVGDSTHLKTEGYGGLPMHVLFARRSIDFYAGLAAAAGLTVDATIALGPDRPAAAAILLAHKPLQT
jgi:SAM-dependent methyltransferase